MVNIAAFVMVVENALSLLLYLVYDFKSQHSAEFSKRYSLLLLQLEVISNIHFVFNKNQLQTL